MGSVDRTKTAGTTGDDANVSRFIPAIELKVSPGERLKTLDALIEQLQQLRRSLVGDVGYRKDALERPGPHVSSPEWPWFIAGTSVGAVIVLLLALARSCA
jgi:hypothetical protein